MPTFCHISLNSLPYVYLWTKYFLTFHFRSYASILHPSRECTPFIYSYPLPLLHLHWPTTIPSPCTTRLPLSLLLSHVPEFTHFMSRLHSSSSYTQPALPAFLKQSLPPSTQQIYRSVVCTQTDLSCLDYPISCFPPTQLHLSRREILAVIARRSAPIATSNLLSNPPVIRSPLFDQLQVQILSVATSFVFGNESRPYYLIELLRAARHLNTNS